MKKLIDDMGVGLLTNLRREMLELAAAGNRTNQSVPLPPTTFERWAEDIAIALHEPQPVRVEA